MIPSKKVHNSFKSPMRLPPIKPLNEQELLQLKADIVQLQNHLGKLNNDIKLLQDEGFSAGELQEHIDKLHEYNEIKDTCQVVLGEIAIRKRTTVAEIHRKYGLELNE